MRVKLGLESCKKKSSDRCEGCPYFGNKHCMEILFSEALALIDCLEKENEFRREMQSRMFAKLSDEAVLHLAVQLLKGE